MSASNLVVPTVTSTVGTRPMAVAAGARRAALACFVWVRVRELRQIESGQV